jgi:pseudaminic acid cytidylyltransferase
MNLAVIPARGGSKRIPRKNLRSFRGKPMIQWTIEAARESGCFDRIVVSTDDDEIARIASLLGVEVPFRRPAELSDDHAGTGAVMQHATAALIGPDAVDAAAVCCLYATAPFMRPDDIRAGRDALRSSGVDFAFPVTTFPYPIQRALRISSSDRIQMLQPQMFELRSQDLEECFHDAGQFYWGTARAWIEARPIFLSDAVPVRLPRSRVQDIDTPEDWERAERLFDAVRSEAN